MSFHHREWWIISTPSPVLVTLQAQLSPLRSHIRRTMGLNAFVYVWGIAEDKWRNGIFSVAGGLFCCGRPPGCVPLILEIVRSRNLTIILSCWSASQRTRQIHKICHFGSGQRRQLNPFRILNAVVYDDLSCARRASVRSVLSSVHSLNMDRHTDLSIPYIANHPTSVMMSVCTSDMIARRIYEKQMYPKTYITCYPRVHGPFARVIDGRSRHCESGVHTPQFGIDVWTGLRESQTAKFESFYST